MDSAFNIKLLFTSDIPSRYFLQVGLPFYRSRHYSKSSLSLFISLCSFYLSRCANCTPLFVFWYGTAILFVSAFISVIINSKWVHNKEHRLLVASFILSYLFPLHPIVTVNYLVLKHRGLLLQRRTRPPGGLRRSYLHKLNIPTPRRYS